LSFNFHFHFLFSPFAILTAFKFFYEFIISFKII
jgi:hypothetical protein